MKWVQGTTGTGELTGRGSGRSPQKVNLCCCLLQELARGKAAMRAPPWATNPQILKALDAQASRAFQKAGSKGPYIPTTF